MRIVLAVVVTVFVSGAFAQRGTDFQMADFMGINTNVASYDQKYIDDLAVCVKWIREYHSWAHYEVADNYYKWDNITKHPQGYTWPDHNKFMDQCRQLGVNVLIDVLNKPAWAGPARGAYSTGDGSKAGDYLDKLEFMGQLVARYGAQTYHDSLLETADKVSGLNYIKYYEDDNEPDYWWESPRWPADKYAVYCNAVHDGYGVETSSEYPLLGIKSVDSTAMHVLGGLAENDVSYLQAILNASDGRIPFDVINIHTYCKDNKDGYSPENENYGLEENLGDFIDWCKQNLPGIPVWLTEFGWDTYSSFGAHSYIFAPEPQQGNYILRAYLIALKMGFEKAFLFMGRDPNSKSILQYSSSGIITDQNTGLAKKVSYYYLATMQKVLGDALLKNIVSYRENVLDNEVFCFEFQHESNEKIFVLWTREKDSKTDTGASLPYNLNIGYEAKYAYIIFPKDKKTAGEKVEIVTNGTEIPLTLTETPQFVVVSEIKTATKELETSDKNFRVFTNSNEKALQITFQNTAKQKVKISIFDVHGSLIKIIENRTIDKGIKYYRFENEGNPGIYFVKLRSENLHATRKVWLY